MSHITVPPVPEDLHPAGCWRKQLTGLDPSQRGGYAALGAFLYAGDTVELPDGALLLQVDKATRGFEDNYRAPGRHAVKDATVTVYLAADGALTELWSRQYVNAKSAFGAATMKKLTALLEKHPVPEEQPVVVREAQRPALKDGPCRWCGKTVHKGSGHRVGHGDEAVLEHYESCPGVTAKTGAVCALCGVTVFSSHAREHVLRDGSGGTEVRHSPYIKCQENPQLSVEEARAERDARERREREEAARQQEKREKARARREEKRRQQEAAKQAEHEAEQARVAQLDTVDRVTKELYDKGLGDGVRARLLEATDTLSDGTTTTRWLVETYTKSGAWGGGWGEVDDQVDDEPKSKEYTRLAEARADYQGMQFTPQRGGGRAEWGRRCDECGGGGAVVERRDSSGIEGMVCRRCDGENPDDVMLSFA